ncbi:MAG: choice-of-anchor R domain-containing protein [Phycisphaerales bacterium JB037]
MMKHCMTAAAIVAIAGAVASAEDLISNLFGASGGSTFIGPSSSTDYKAAAFTMPGGSKWLFGSVELEIDFSAAGPNPVVEIWGGSGTVPTTRLATLENPSVMSGLGTYRFTLGANDDLVLRPNTRYWVRVSATTGGDFSWIGTANVNPTGVANFNGFVFNDAASSTENKLRVNAVPLMVDNFDGTADNGPDGGTSAFPKEFGWVNASGQDHAFRGFELDMDFGAGDTLSASIRRGFPTPSGGIIGINFPNRTGEVILRFNNPFHTVQQPGDPFWVTLNDDPAGNPLWEEANPDILPNGFAGDPIGYLFLGGPSSVQNRLAIASYPLITNASENSPTDAGATLLFGPDRIKAASFSLAVGRQARAEFLRIGLDRSANPGIVELWRGDTRPSVFLGTWEDPEVITNLSVGQVLRYRLRTPVVLSGGQRYWTVVRADAAAGAGTLAWLLNENSDPTPRGLAVGGEFLFSIDGGATFPGSSIRNNDFSVFGPGQNNCPVDFTTSSDPNDDSYRVPNGVYDSEDFFFYLDGFTAGNRSVCDLTASSDPIDPGFGIRDGICDSADFFYFLDLFVQGCP